ncbi:MAG TPA: hypothetical protein PK694_03335 [Rhodospirillales bacterium]|nr:hypothetical protein [Rhodospirillales bacterium]
MADVLGTTPAVFLVVTGIVIGFAAYMTGQAIANTWRPVWQLVVYALLLGIVARFLIFALFDGELLSLSGYAASTALLFLIGVFAYRLTRARKMVHQYPWLYERSGLFGWRRRA